LKLNAQITKNNILEIFEIIVQLYLQLKDFFLSKKFVQIFLYDFSIWQSTGIEFIYAIDFKGRIFIIAHMYRYKKLKVTIYK